MKKLCFLILSILSLPVFAQYVAEEPTSGKLKKNDLGLQMNPFLVTVMGGMNEGLSYGIVYKRLIAENSRLRFSLSYAFDNSSYRREVPIAVVDSLLYKSTQNESFKDAEFRIGREWCDFRKPNDAIYAVDIIAGHRTNVDQLNTSIHNMNIYTGNGLYGEVMADSLTKRSTQKSLAFGLGFSAGYRVTIQDRLELMATVSPEVVYYTTYESSETPIESDATGSDGIEFRFRLLDIVLTYRF